MPFGVAVLGTGRLGGRYIEVVKKTPGAKIVMVAEPNEEAAAKWKDMYPDVEFVKDYKDALKRADVQVVVGTLPHWLHKQASVDAANAGKHIYVEKPMAVWAKEGHEMLAAARANNVKLMTAHTQRYMPSVKAAKQLVDSGKYGQLVMAYDYWNKPYDPYIRPKWMLDRQLGGGMGQMDGTHEIDRLLWIIGYDVDTVSARVGQITHPASKYKDIKADDTAMCFIRWKSGVTATIARMAWDKGATEYGGDLFMTDGFIRFRVAYGRGPEQKTGIWIADNHDGTLKFQDVPETDSMADEFADFIASLERGDADTPIPQEHGLKVLEVLDATEESSRTGREVVLGWD
jgi:predicted dehydrogenase